MNRGSVGVRRMRLGALAVAVVAAVALAGCSDEPGSAAYVGDHQITTEQVQDASAEVLAAAAGLTQVPLNAAEVNRGQVNRMVTEQLITVEAERRDLSVTDAEVDALLQQAVGTTSRAEFERQLAASQLVPPSQIDEFARIVALNQKLLGALAPGADDAAASDAVVKQLGALSTELGTGVSPRFGTWDPATLTVGPPPDDLSTPAPSATSLPELSSGTVRTD